MHKKALTRVICGLAILVAVATFIAYYVIKADDKPWLAFFVACCGGVIVFNFLLSLFLINKNFKK